MPLGSRSKTPARAWAVCLGEHVGDKLFLGVMVGAIAAAQDWIWRNG